MKFDANLTDDITAAGREATDLEASGHDGIWVGETAHDPFLHLLPAALATERATIGTAVAIAFGRSPLTIAHSAHDLAQHSQGRFVLGLGSQVKPHIERRFSMPWSRPAARMRELVLALRALWSSWQDGTPLDFRGEFYTHTLMTPFFSPAPHPWGPPPVVLAGVGQRMTEVAGEVADGFLVHPFTTQRFVDTVTLPALRAGRARAGRADLEGFTVGGPAFVAVGDTEEALAASVRRAKQQIAFYASTSAYHGVLDAHDRGELGPALARLAQQGDWERMGDLVDDELLHLVAVVGDPEAVGRGLVERWAGTYQRLSVHAAHDLDLATRLAVIRAARSVTTSASTERTGGY